MYDEMNFLTLGVSVSHLSKKCSFKGETEAKVYLKKETQIREWEQFVNKKDIFIGSYYNVIEEVYILTWKYYYMAVKEAFKEHLDSYFSPPYNLKNILHCVIGSTFPTKSFKFYIPAEKVILRDDCADWIIGNLIHDFCPVVLKVKTGETDMPYWSTNIVLSFIREIDDSKDYIYASYGDKFYLSNAKIGAMLRVVYGEHIQNG